MADPKHYVVMEGLGNGSSDYTIEGTGQVEQVDGRLGGLSVSSGSQDRVHGGTVNGTVWAGNDGFRIYGGIKNINIENPDHVQVHTGSIAGEPPRPDEECEVTVRAERVEFVSGQGIGEGALELEIEHDIHGGQSERDTNIKLPTGSSENLGTSIDNFKVPQSGSEPKTLTTKITERDRVAADWFTGHNDDGHETMEITLACDEPREVSQNVPIDSDRDNPGEVKVYYTVGDLSD